MNRFFEEMPAAARGFYSGRPILFRQRDGVFEWVMANFRVDQLQRPDWIFLSFHAPKAGHVEQRVPRLLSVAEVAHELFESLSLRVVWQVSESSVQALIPILRSYDFGAVLDFAAMLSLMIVERSGHLATMQAVYPQSTQRVLVDERPNLIEHGLSASFFPCHEGSSQITLPVRWEDLKGATALPSFTTRVSASTLQASAQLLERAGSQPNDLENSFIFIVGESLEQRRKYSNALR